MPAPLDTDDEPEAQPEKSYRLSFPPPNGWLNAFDVRDRIVAALPGCPITREGVVELRQRARHALLDVAATHHISPEAVDRVLEERCSRLHENQLCYSPVLTELLTRGLREGAKLMLRQNHKDTADKHYTHFGPLLWDRLQGYLFAAQADLQNPNDITSRADWVDLQTVNAMLPHKTPIDIVSLAVQIRADAISEATAKYGLSDPDARARAAAQVNNEYIWIDDNSQAMLFSPKAVDAIKIGRWMNLDEVAEKLERDELWVVGKAAELRTEYTGELTKHFIEQGYGIKARQRAEGEVIRTYVRFTGTQEHPVMELSGLAFDDLCARSRRDGFAQTAIRPEGTASGARLG